MSRYGSEKKDGSPCPYCSRTMKLNDLKLYPTFDHIIPRSRTRGKYGRGLLVCSECNFMKADRNLSEFIASLEAKNKALQTCIDLNNERLENISFLLQIGIEE